jgi:hypothetical protein
VKKLVAVILAVVLVVGMAVPVVAQTTEVQVTAGGGGPPVVKCKWETPDDGDTGPGTQILPSGAYQVNKDIHFWAVVTDPEGVDTVASVYADVWHPSGMPECGSFKFQLGLLEVAKQAGIDAFEAADAAQLVTYGAGHDYTTVWHQLDQGLAKVFEGTQVMSYHQPAGDYLVKVKAYDIPGNPSVPLENTFTYVATTAMEVDFSVVNYGSVQVCSNKWIGGDLNFGTAALPTVRNIGNTALKVTVLQDDMLLGMTSGVWNVEYDARLGNDTGNNTVYYDPCEKVMIPDTLPLCNTQKLDFSIHVKFALPGTYGGTMTLSCSEVPFDCCYLPCGEPPQ